MQSSTLTKGEGSSFTTTTKDLVHHAADPVSEAVVIGLTICRKEELNFKRYRRLSTEQKILRIVERIELMCKQLIKIHPNAIWVFIWPEYGVRGNINRAISKDEKDFFKKNLSMLTNRYRNLAIIAGSISTYKISNDETKLNNIQKYYKNWQAVKEYEMTSKNKEQWQFFHHEQELKKVKYAIKNVAKSHFTIVRNTAFVFFGNDIYKHDKNYIYYETAFNPTLSNVVFQPAHDTNMNPIFYLRHPMTGKLISIIVQICRENGAIDFLVEQNLFPNNKLDIQAVVSDHTDLISDHALGKVVIQLDTMCKSKLITSPWEGSIAVKYYENNLLDDNVDLSHHKNNQTVQNNESTKQTNRNYSNIIFFNSFENNHSSNSDDNHLTLSCNQDD